MCGGLIGCLVLKKKFGVGVWLKFEHSRRNQAGLDGMLRIFTTDQNGDYETSLIQAGLLDHGSSYKARKEHTNQHVGTV